MITEDRLEALMETKDYDESMRAMQEPGATHAEFWAIIDGTLIVYDGNEPPLWLKPVLDSRDVNGNTPDHPDYDAVSV